MPASPPPTPEAIRRARKAAGLTQAQLADRLGISQAQASRLETVGKKGRPPRGPLRVLLQQFIQASGGSSSG